MGGAGGPRAWAPFWDPNCDGLPRVRPLSREAKLRFHLKVETPVTRQRLQAQQGHTQSGPTPQTSRCPMQSPETGHSGHTPTLTLAAEHAQRPVGASSHSRLACVYSGSGTPRGLRKATRSPTCVRNTPSSQTGQTRKPSHQEGRDSPEAHSSETWEPAFTPKSGLT